MIPKNEEIRRDCCRLCSIYNEIRDLTSAEMSDCATCYSGLKKGNDMEHILKKYRIEM